MRYQEEKRYIGNLAQLFNVKSYRLEGGRAQGVLCTDINNGSGLNITIAADRCMDLYYASFKGYNLSYISPCGTVAPQYYENDGYNWQRSFTAGLLTTCGLANFGKPCTDNGEELGLHGRIGNIPADEYSVSTDLENGEPCVTVKGKMLQSKLFSEHLQLSRTYKVRYGINEIEMTDVVENIGYRPWEFMILYHFNFGYPLLSEDAQVYLPTKHVQPRDEISVPTADRWNLVEQPVDNLEETCYFHTMGRDEKGNSMAMIYNHKLDIGVCYTFDAEQLDHFIQWKYMGSGEYVMGLEPGNALVTGRDKARQSGRLKFLQPQEKKEFKFIIKFLEGPEQLEAQKATMAKMK